MRFDVWLLGIIAFVAVMSGGFLLFTDVDTNYNVNISNTYYAHSYNISKEIANVSVDMNNLVFSNSSDTSVVSSATALVSGSVQAVRLVPKSFIWVGQILSDTAQMLGIPPLIVGLAISAMIILLIVAAIYLFFSVVN